MSSPRIAPLPLHLANQIAAGEVIERPASVVKELVENSIDAGATQVSIDIEGAGSQLIRVKDNGHGIHRDDLALALSRHATSKLTSSEQLSKINSLGFRGEALPSISSVAHFSLTSRQAGDDCGWQIIGDQQQPHPASHPTGTSIEVRDLFFNLPARRRFLRSNKTEQNHILTTLYRLALSRFDVGFSCQMSSSNKIKLAPALTDSEKQQRIAKLCGQSFVDKSRYIEQSYNDIILKGWLGQSSAHRPQTDIQYFFINGRVIRDRIINHAIRLAYGDLIPAGRHPAYVLYLELPLERVDVNVHPTKHEVRFREARLIHGLITSAVEDGLNQPANSSPPVKKAKTQSKLALEITEPQTSYTAKPQHKPTTTEKSSTLKAINLVQQRYLLVEHLADAWLVDLQEAERHLKQQQFLAAIHQNSLSVRPILVPLKFAISMSQSNAFQQLSPILSALGFTYSLTGQSIQLTQIPSLLANIELPELVEKLSSLTENSHFDLAILAIEVSKLIPLSPIVNIEQAKLLLEQLSLTEEKNSWSCKLDQQRLSGLFSQ
jgi:DNA mismatch repair protein MutL